MLREAPLKTAGKEAHTATAVYKDTGQHGCSLLISDRSLCDTTEGCSSKSEGQTVHAPTTVRSQATSRLQHACLLETLYIMQNVPACTAATSRCKSWLTMCEVYSACCACSG